MGVFVGVVIAVIITGVLYACIIASDDSKTENKKIKSFKNLVKYNKMAKKESKNG